MNRLLLASMLGFSLIAASARAEELIPKQDDKVVFDLSAEDWVTTKTAHVEINVEAAVSNANAGTMRADMIKAVNDLARADWRLTNFERTQDSTGLERWSTTFEARLPEGELSGLGDNVKKLSKAGLQLTVGNIDFSPTLEEMETARASVRTQIYKSANDQLTALNAALPGHNYRIATINFTGEDEPTIIMPHVMRGRPMMALANGGVSESSAPNQPVERAQKVILNARVVLAALAPASADVKR